MKKSIVVLIAVYMLCVTANAQYTQKEYDFLRDIRSYESTMYLARIRPPAGGQYVPKEAAEWDKIILEMKNVDALCKRYGPFPKRDDREYGWPRALCDMLADPSWIKTRGIQVGVDFWVMDYIVGKDIRAEYNNFNDVDVSIPDRFQEMVFEPETFRSRLEAEITPEYTKRGVTIPPTWMDIYWKESYLPLVERIKKRIEYAMSSDSFKLGTAKDPALERVVRANYAKLPNATKIQVLRVAFNNAVWSATENYRLVGSDSKYNYYKVTPGTKFRGGFVVAKVEGRPGCQARPFLFRRAPGGAVQVDEITQSGRFIPCP